MTSLDTSRTEFPPRIDSAGIQAYWRDFTPEEVDWIDGRVGRLIHAVATKCGLSQDEAARQVARYFSPQQAKEPT